MVRVPSDTEFEFKDIGLVGYSDYLEGIPRIVSGNLDGKVRVFLCEHPRIITIGRTPKGKMFRTEKVDWPVLKTDRGGSITAHFPGQLMLYPVFNLKALGLGLSRYFRELIGIVRRALERLGVEVEEKDNGLWMGREKVASFGVACRRFWVYHGAGITYRLDPEVNRMVYPCGEEGAFGQIRRSGGEDVDREELKLALVEEILRSDVFRR